MRNLYRSSRASQSYEGTSPLHQSLLQWKTLQTFTVKNLSYSNKAKFLFLFWFLLRRIEIPFGFVEKNPLNCPLVQAWLYYYKYFTNKCVFNLKQLQPRGLILDTTLRAFIRKCWELSWPWGNSLGSINTSLLCCNEHLDIKPLLSVAGLLQIFSGTHNRLGTLWAIADLPCGAFRKVLRKQEANTSSAVVGCSGSHLVHLLPVLHWPSFHQESYRVALDVGSWSALCEFTGPLPDYSLTPPSDKLGCDLHPKVILFGKSLS